MKRPERWHRQTPRRLKTVECFRPGRQAHWASLSQIAGGVQTTGPMNACCHRRNQRFSRPPMDVDPITFLRRRKQRSCRQSCGSAPARPRYVHRGLRRGGSRMPTLPTGAANGKTEARQSNSKSPGCRPARRTSSAIMASAAAIRIASRTCFSSTGFSNSRPGERNSGISCKPLEAILHGGEPRHAAPQQRIQVFQRPRMPPIVRSISLHVCGRLALQPSCRSISLRVSAGGQWTQIDPVETDLPSGTG